ncbi:hypothetical protein [Nguyenibacter sp. L1]|uniref:hypothetical protein n=1 Tax=Nguyenibacter sp. L1 TaxID=3049350 RepID=UPI002B46A7B4|nr:hypothetical protein [Nguyenibacter sp. L1]WRH88028.1 hypothetical protein QN315_19240 [Nguyenibacter sp. L1]
MNATILFRARRGLSCVLLSCVLPLVGGCGTLDPYHKPYAWHPSGANAANLAAMVADPRDLREGHGGEAPDAQAPVMAVERIRLDKPKALPSTNGISGGVSGSSGSGSGGGSSGGPSGGGGN